VSGPLSSLCCGVTLGGQLWRSQVFNDVAKRHNLVVNLWFNVGLKFLRISTVEVELPVITASSQ
jgi:hypothetical protein